MFQISGKVSMYVYYVSINCMEWQSTNYVQIVEEGLLSLSGALFDWQVLFWSLISSCTPHAWLHVSWSLGQNPLGRHPCILPYFPWRFESGSWYDTALHDAAVPPDHGSISMYFYVFLFYMPICSSSFYPQLLVFNILFGSYNNTWAF